MSEEEDSPEMMKAALGIGPKHGKRSWEFILKPEPEQGNEDD